MRVYNKMRYSLAIDIGGSKVLVAIVSSKGDVSYSYRSELQSTINERKLIDIIVKLSKKVLSECKYDIHSCGVSIPGLTNSDSGKWIFAPFSNIKNFNIGDILAKKLNMNIYIENDVNACAIAEKTVGNCKEIENFLWMTISNGIGGAIYINNKIYKGAFSYAGEIGHITVVENGTSCGCGSNGCLEQYASGASIEHIYYKATNKKYSAKQIAIFANEGDLISKEIYNNVGKYIGLVLSHVINLLNLEKIILGGGVSQDYKLFKNALLKEFNRNIFLVANKNIIIEVSKLGYNASLIGAGLIALSREGLI